VNVGSTNHMDTFGERISPQVIQEIQLSAYCGRKLQPRLGKGLFLARGRRHERSPTDQRRSQPAKSIEWPIRTSGTVAQSDGPPRQATHAMATTSRAPASASIQPDRLTTFCSVPWTQLWTQIVQDWIEPVGQRWTEEGG
jgi:hypothetical protein